MTQTDTKSKELFAFSPFVLTIICAVIQLIAGHYLGVWAWAPTMLGFWLIIGYFLCKYPISPLQRFQPASGSLLWSLLAVMAGLLSLYGFLSNWRLLIDINLIVAWLVFALVNPWFEESYWRGLLIDSTNSWGKFASLLYSSVWFAASHPLIWGIHSTSLRKPEAVGALLFVGLIWGWVYQRTGSLRWTVVGHMLANLLGLSALVLLNLYDPTAR